MVALSTSPHRILVVQGCIFLMTATIFLIVVIIADVVAEWTVIVHIAFEGSRVLGVDRSGVVCGPN